MGILEKPQRKIKPVAPMLHRHNRRKERKQQSDFSYLMDLIDKAKNGDVASAEKLYKLSGCL